jgi:hypothetical protein
MLPSCRRQRARSSAPTTRFVIKDTFGWY